MPGDMKCRKTIGAYAEPEAVRRRGGVEAWPLNPALSDIMGRIGSAKAKAGIVTLY